MTAAMHPDQNHPAESESLETRLATALGPGESLTENQERLLDILLTPDPGDPLPHHHPTVTEILDEYRLFTGADIDDDWPVAERLREHYYQHGLPTFEFEHIRDRDGLVTTYNVLVAVGEPHLWLTVSDEIRRLGGGPDRVTGLRAALRTAEVLDNDYQWLCAKAESLGLLGEPNET